MKINYRNTCLHWLEHPEQMEFHIPESTKGLTEEEKYRFGHSVRKGFADAVKAGMFKGKVRLISLPFFEAYEKGKYRLADIFDKEEMEDTGTFITQLGSWTNTYFYYLRTYIEEGQWKVQYSLMIFTKHSQAEMPGLDVCIFDDGKMLKSFIYKGWEEAHDATESFWMAWIVSLLLFIKYCPIETKFVDPQRRGHHAGQKYVNETNQKIEILDSTWFTTIIRSAGFNVGGHFRMQPYGPGLAQKKLIWIEPFEKHGYTRKAHIA